jgi:hypothetical protein
MDTIVIKMQLAERINGIIKERVPDHQTTDIDQAKLR